MPIAERRLDSANRRATRILRDLGDELRVKRRAVGQSQRVVAAAARIDRSRYSRIESARISTLSIAEACRVAAVLGLDVAVRCYPGGEPLRDLAQIRRLERLRASLAPPLTMAFEVPLPSQVERTERRAWDAVITAPSGRMKVEVEMRLTDAQAQARSIALKHRDDPLGELLVVVADTRHNRRALALHPDGFAPGARIAARVVLGSLRAGRLPPGGLVLL